MGTFAKHGIAIALLFTVTGASSADGTSPKYESLLIQVLMANRQGICPTQLMVADLQAACTSQLGDLMPKLKKLGKVTGVTYLGDKPIESEAGEVYKVSFEHGDWTWTLSAKDGKESLAYAPPPVWHAASRSGTTSDSPVP